MGEFSLNKKETIFKAIFISVFFHAAILGTIVFSFTISPAYQKPFFVFLGSILPKQDFLLSRGSYSRTVINTQTTPRIFMLSKDSLYPLSISKPSFHNTISGRTKLLFKGKAFSTTDQQEDKNNSEMIEKSLGIESNIPPYAPLKLYTK